MEGNYIICVPDGGARHCRRRSSQACCGVKHCRHSAQRIIDRQAGVRLPAVPSKLVSRLYNTDWQTVCSKSCCREAGTRLLPADLVILASSGPLPARRLLRPYVCWASFTYIVHVLYCPTLSLNSAMGTSYSHGRAGKWSKLFQESSLPCSRRSRLFQDSRVRSISRLPRLRDCQFHLRTT
jgi:hypothetical protein